MSERKPGESKDEPGLAAFAMEPVIAEIIKALDSNKSFDHIPASASKIYLWQVKRAEGLGEVWRRITAATTHAAGAVVEPYGAVLHGLREIFDKEAERLGVLALMSATRSAIEIAQRAAAASTETFRRILFEAAVHEFERARLFLEHSKTSHRDAFMINLVEAYCLSQLAGAEQDAQKQFDSCAEMLEHSLRRVSAEAEALKPRAEKMEATAASLREYYGEDEINKSGARIELGRVTSDDPFAWIEEPVNVLSNIQAITDEYRRKHELETRIARVVDKLRKATTT
ncbi:MAG: hypothetical protein QOH25_483 [Acidobacteriota bacterium]|jgi:hypothetical protein|nr:hypothetical protein [Acidobacteriota bacterium]